MLEYISMGLGLALPWSMFITIEANRDIALDLWFFYLLLLRLIVKSMDWRDTPRTSIDMRPSSTITLLKTFWNCWS